MVGEKQRLELLDGLMFGKIFQSFRMAAQPGKLMVALLGLIIICLAGYVMDFSRSVVVAPETQGGVSELDVYVGRAATSETVAEFRSKYEDTGVRTGVFSTLWRFGSEKFHTALMELFNLKFASVAENIGAYFKGVGWAIRYHYVYCLILVAIKLAVLSVVGGAICRMAALQFARGEKTGLMEALRFSSSRFTSFFFAPLLPVAFMAVIGGLIFLVGLAGRIPYVGGLFVGILMLLVLAGGALIAVGLIGGVAGFNLMFPAVAYDGSDAFDAISRSFSYVFSRPWRMGFYTLTAAVHGAVCYVCVRLFAFLLLSVAHVVLFCAVGTGDSGNKLAAIWAKPEFMNLLGSSSTAPASLIEDVAGFIIYLFLWVVAGLVVSVVISYYFSANTVIYSLMRNKVDNAALDDVYLDSDDLRVYRPESLGP
ncbi:MAG: hypothetical protein ISS79_04600 [Phycisphaerae bacterium]|nr:hypothetical protein [Phycisphaerae bacterium]